MSNHETTARDLIALVGGHSAATLGIGLDDDAQLGRWLVAVCLAGPRVDEARWKRAFGELERIGLADPGSIAGGADDAVPSSVHRTGVELEAALRTAEHPDAERTAWRLIRVSTALMDHYQGSVDRLARAADDLEQLGGRLAALAPGFGTASVTRFLRPLRDRWSEASEIPLHPAAMAAAVHLGFLGEDPDPDGAPAILRSAIGLTDTPAFRDLEAALERLGGWCRRNRANSCPLADGCPARLPRTAR